MKSNEFTKTDFEPVEFHNNIHPRIKVEPIYFNKGFSPKPEIYGRFIVLERLLKALNSLPSQYGFLVWDVYRPRAIQATLFDWMSEEIRKKMPHLTDEENYVETRKYVSLPSKVGEEYCAPHLSGGAIDLTLIELATGTPLDMGTPFDDCSEIAHRDYFELMEQMTVKERIIKEHRLMLRLAMEEVGFTSYQYEWWHYDLGTILWSRSLNQPPVFGPLFGNDEWP